MLDMICTFLNLLRLVLWPSMWSIMENVPCALEKNIYSVAFEWDACEYQLNSFGLIYHLWPVFPYWFAVWMICPLMKVGCWSPHYYCITVSVFFFFFFNYFDWKLITLQYCGGFCYTLTWISHGCTCVLQSWIPLPPPSPSDPSGLSQCTDFECPVSCI